MTAGRTNHTKFAAAPQAKPATPADIAVYDSIATNYEKTKLPVAYPLDDESPLIANQLYDFMYHGFGSSEDNRDIKAAFMSIGLPEKMANDIMARIVWKP